MFVTIDKHQCWKSFFSQTTSIRLECLSSIAEKSLVSNLEFLTIPSNWGLWCFQLCDGLWIVCKCSIALCSFSFEMKRTVMLSCTSVYWTKSQWSTKPHWFCCCYPWMISVDMLYAIISGVGRCFWVG